MKRTQSQKADTGDQKLARLSPWWSQSLLDQNYQSVANEEPTTRTTRGGGGEKTMKKQLHFCPELAPSLDLTFLLV